MPTVRSSAHPLVSIVILCYKSEKFIVPCLRSLAATDWSAIEIIVVDNASGDGSLREAVSWSEDSGIPIREVPLTANCGCAGGNNAGWRKSNGQFVIFLNPDTEVTPTFVRELINPMCADSTIGITGAKIYYPGTRTLQHAGGYICPNGMTNHFGSGEEDKGQYDTVRDVDYVTGAGFAIRRSLLEQLGGFDEDYFPAYFEETDLCTRTLRLGSRVVYIPQAVLYHHESVSLVVNSPSFRRLYQRMRIRYCLKNFTLRDWLMKFIPFEFRWMRHEPAARGYRAEQFRAYGEAIAWRIRKAF